MTFVESCGQNLATGVQEVRDTAAAGHFEGTLTMNRNDDETSLLERCNKGPELCNRSGRNKLTMQEHERDDAPSGIEDVCFFLQKVVDAPRNVLPGLHVMGARTHRAHAKGCKIVGFMFCGL